MQEPLLDSDGEAEEDTSTNPRQVSRGGRSFTRTGGYHSDVGAAAKDPVVEAPAAVSDYDEEAAPRREHDSLSLRGPPPTLGRSWHKRIFTRLSDKRGVRIRVRTAVVVPAPR